jgi:acyl-CoA synthetase (AMP-forming)/AMP-acid ligase II
MSTIHTGPYDDVEIPDVDITSFVFERADELGDKPALIDGPTGRTLTYAELVGGIRALASGLAARGFGKGDVLAIYMPNLPEYAIAFHGATSAGGMATTMNPLYTAGEVAHQLEDSGAKLLVTVGPFLEAASEAAEKAGIGDEVYVVGEPEGARSFTELLGDPAEAPELEVEAESDLAVLPYSSGTTGLPKGVMLTHRNLVANLNQTIAAQQLEEGDVLVGVLPFFHIYGMQVIMNLGLRHGATVVTMPRFDLDQFLSLIEEHGVTRAYVVPPIALALAKHPAVDEHDVSSLQMIMSGAAPLGSELSEAVEKRTGATTIQGYGLTETSPVTHCIPATGGRSGSIGPPLPNTECRIVDPESGEDVPEGDRGELWIRGPQVMKGYLNNEEATAATIDDEGWLHTGDIAVVDDEGNFEIVDRLKELIKYKGFQVPPAELEALLITHPKVQDVAVIGVADEEAGELPKAYIVPGEDVDHDELMAWVGERVAPQKKIRLVEEIDEIPKSPSGKILRRKLVEREREAAAG